MYPLYGLMPVAPTCSPGWVYVERHALVSVEVSTRPPKLPIATLHAGYLRVNGSYCDSSMIARIAPLKSAAKCASAVAVVCSMDIVAASVARDDS